MANEILLSTAKTALYKELNKLSHFQQLSLALELLDMSDHSDWAELIEAKIDERAASHDEN